MAKKPINGTITCKEDGESSLETTGYFEICTFYSTEKKKTKALYRRLIIFYI